MANAITNYFFRRRVKKVNNLNRLVNLHEHRYYQLTHKGGKATQKLNDLNQKNDLFKYKDNEFSRKKAFIILLSPLFVAMIDVLLANVVLRELVSQLQLAYIFSGVLLVAVTIVFVEINLGLYLDTTDANPEALNFDDAITDDSWYSKLKKFMIKSKRPVLGFLAVLFVFIVPLISLSEYFAQKGVYSTMHYNGRMSDAAYTQSVTSLQLKYFGLSLMSFITHIFLMAFSKDYISTWSLFSYLKKKDKLVKKMDTVEEKQKSVESDIVLSMIKYHQSVELLKNDYPNLPANKYPSGLFSENVVRLYDSYNMIQIK